VVDLGSNSFRLVVFTSVAGRWWKRTDEIHEVVRIGAGLDASGRLGEEPMERALQTLELYSHFCRASGVRDVRAVATSAIRDASNREQFLAAARERSGLQVQVLDPEQEARFGYLAAVNSTTLADGAVLDLGGGSAQLVRVVGRRARDLCSWPVGAVRMTERFLPDKRASRKQLKALRGHLREELGQARWLADCGPGGGRLVGVGGTVRNLAAAVQLVAGLPSHGVQGFEIGLDGLAGLVARMAEMSAAERGRLPGIKSGRGDVVLAGAMVVQTVLELGGLEGIEATEAGLREGVFFSSYLKGDDPPLFADVRHDGVLNLARQYEADAAHVEHVARLSLEMFDALAAAGLHPGDALERELLWAAAILHDIGTSVDYDDHHKHSRYLILSAGLPGFSPRETALIGQVARYHRKGAPTLGEFGPLAVDGDQQRLLRCSALLRLAEQLERSRDQLVRATRVRAGSDGDVCLELVAVGDGDVSVARWAAERQRDLFAQAFGRPLSLAA